MRWPWKKAPLPGDKDLLQALTQKNMEVCARILAQNPELTKVLFPGGISPLHFAIASSLPEAVALLLKAGADLKAGPISALWLAIMEDESQCLEALLNAGANPQTSDNQGTPPLCFAAQMGLNKVVAALLAHGADLNARDAEGDTPLMCAASNSNKETVTILLAAGANPHQRNFDGMSALDKAIKPDVWALLNQAGMLDK